MTLPPPLGPPIRLVDVTVLNDVRRYCDARRDRVGAAEAYELTRVIADTVALAASAWEALDVSPGIPPDVGRRVVVEAAGVAVAVLFGRTRVFGREATVAIDVRLTERRGR